MRFQWDEKFILGVKEIDDQHRKLVDILARLEKNIQEGAPDISSWSTIFQDLEEYSRYHFKTEEDLMLEYAFPGYTDHCHEHAIFIAKIAELKGRFEAHDLQVIDDLLYFLMLWLQNHVLTVDRKYCTYLVEKGFQ